MPPRRSENDEAGVQDDGDTSPDLGRVHFRGLLLRGLLAVIILAPMLSVVGPLVASPGQSMAPRASLGYGNAGLSVAGSSASFTTTPSSGSAGTTVSASGTGFVPNSAITFTVDGTSVTSTCLSDGVGAFPGTTGTSCSFTIPQVPGGVVPIVAADTPAKSQIASVTVGTRPIGVAYDSVKSEIFIVNQGSSSVSVIDDSTNTVVATVAVGSSPSAAVYDSGKGEVFVANLVSNSVSVINDSTNTVVTTISVGYNPLALAYDSGKGEIFVANSNSHTVSVINDTSNSVVATVPFSGSNPNGLAYDSGANEVFVSLLSASASQVGVISDASNTVVATVNVGSSPAGLAYDGRQGEIWVADSGTNLVSVISDSNNTAWTSITVGKGPESLAYDPSAGYLFEPSTGVSTLGVLSDSALYEVNVVSEGGSNGAQGVAYDSGTNEVFVANYSGGTTDVFPAGSAPSTPFAVTAALKLTPSTGPVGTSVTADGTGFVASGSVTIHMNGASVTTNPSPCTTLKSGSFSCTFTVPASPAGAAKVTATDGTNSASSTFTVSSSLSLSPTNGVVGTTVTATGAGFAASATITITFGGATVTTSPSPCTSSTAGGFSCTFVIPTSPAGATSVVASDGTNHASASFVVNPKITLSPTGGPGGTLVAVSGTGFAASGTISVTFAGSAVATNPSPCSTILTGSFSCSITVPQVPGGPATVTATDSVNSASATFSVQTTLAVTPTSGIVGTKVSVTGTGFAATTSITITFNGATVSISPSPCTTSSTGAFTCSFIVPPAPGGPDQVKASDGTNVGVTFFSVTPDLTLSPTRGPVGTIVSASGTGFGASGSTTVRYNGLTVATSPGTCPTSASGSFTCTFVVPASTAGANTVSAITGTLSASATFTVTPSLMLVPPAGPVASVVSATGIGFAGSAAISITFNGVGMSTAPSACLTSAVGSFTCTFVVPKFANGPYTVTATDGTNTASSTFMIISSVPPYQVQRTVNPASYTFAKEGSVSVGLNGGPNPDPQGVVYDSGNGYIYVANHGSYTVTVVNPAILNSGGTNSVVATINLTSPPPPPPGGNITASCTQPIGEAYDFGTNTIWVVCDLSNTVDVIATSGKYANQVVETVLLPTPACADPYADAYDSSDSEVYVTTTSAPNVCAISDSSFATTTIYISSHSSLGIAYDSANKEVYVAASGTNNIIAISGGSFPTYNNHIVGTFPVLNPWGVAYDSGQGQIWVTICCSFVNPGQVNVFSDGTTFTSLGSANVGMNPQWAWYDLGQGEVVVSSSASKTNDLTFVNDTSPFTITYSLSLGGSSTSGAEGVGFDPALNEIWVADTASSLPGNPPTVDEVTANTNPAGLGAFGVAYDSVDQTILVTNPGARTVTIFSDSTLILAHTVSSLPSSPYGIAYGNGYFAVSCPAASKVEMFNAAGPGSPIATLVTTGTPQNITYDSTNQNFYVAETVANFVGWISTSSPGSVGETPISTSSSFVAYDPSLTELFVGSAASSSLSAYSVSGASLTLAGTVTLPTGASPQGIAYDGAFGETFVTINNQGLVSVVDDSTLTTVGSGVTVGTAPAGIAYDSGKGLLFVVNSNPNTLGLAGSVSVIDERSNTVIATVSVGYGPFMIAYDSGLGEMFVVNAYAGTMSVLSA